MSDFQKQLVVLALDKGLLALILAILAFLAKRYLDRLNAQTTYRQRLADERIRAYKEISRIVAEQGVMVAWLRGIFDHPHDTREQREEIMEEYLAHRAKMVDNWRIEMAKMQAEMPFVSSHVADKLIAYVDSYTRFRDFIHSVTSETPPNFVEFLKIQSGLQHAIGSEIHDFKI